MREGDRVSFIGFPTTGMSLGDQGRVVSASGDASHVLWATGARASQVDFVNDLDLVRVTKSKASTVLAHLEDSLEIDLLVSVAVRETFDEVGEAGLLNALSDTGHLAGLSQIAEDAMEFVSARIRADVSFAEVLASLDPDEGSALVALASSALLRDVFSLEADGDYP